MVDLNKKIDSLTAFVTRLSKEVDKLKRISEGATTTEIQPQVVKQQMQEAVPTEQPKPKIEKPPQTQPHIKTVTPNVKIVKPPHVQAHINTITPNVNNIKRNGPAMVNEFQQLKSLLNTAQWPAAVDPSLICNLSSDQDKEDRAEGILDLIIDIHLENLKFLDFGCGEGHVVNKSLLQKPKMSVGYDIRESEKWKVWESTENMKFTTDWGEVEAEGPYNVILLYDVLDHMLMPDDKIVEELQKIKRVLAPNGKIYVRCHPWSSRHGTHLYHQVNKAFVHLVFTENELESMGYNTEVKANKIIHPITYYADCFKKAGLKVVYGPQVLKEDVESFFLNNPIVSNRIRKNWKISHDPKLNTGKDFPTVPCQIQFVDYIFTK